MKRINFFLVAAIISIVALNTNAQVGFQIGGGVGYSIPTGDFGGSTSDYYMGTKYGMESALNLHAKARLSLLFLNVFGEVGYTSFSNNGSISAAEPDKTVDVTNKVFSIKVGPEYKLSIPMSPITPYINAFVSLNSFSGTVQFKGSPNGLPSSEQSLNSASRVGAGAGAGVLFSLGGLNLDLNVQYHLMNIAGKEFGGSKDSRLDSYIYLNDDKDPLYAPNDDKHIISSTRSIDAIEVKLTAMFGL